MKAHDSFYYVKLLILKNNYKYLYRMFILNFLHLKIHTLYNKKILIYNRYLNPMILKYVYIIGLVLKNIHLRNSKNYL